MAYSENNSNVYHSFLLLIYFVSSAQLFILTLFELNGYYEKYEQVVPHMLISARILRDLLKRR